MVTVALVSSPNGDDAPDSVPRRVFDAAPNVEIELESLVPLGGNAIPYVWVWGDELVGFERALVEDEAVTAVEVLERVDGGALFRVEWTVDSPVIECVDRAGGSLMGAHGTAERWELDVWFEAGEDARRFQECCRDRGVPLEVKRLRTVAEAADADDAPVTRRQREALVTAYESGYFERPREATQADVAQQLGISAAATGNRLSRGTANLVKSLLDDV